MAKSNPKTGSAAVAKRRLLWCMAHDREAVTCLRWVQKGAPSLAAKVGYWQAADASAAVGDHAQAARFNRAAKPRCKLERRTSDSVNRSFAHAERITRWKQWQL